MTKGVILFAFNSPAYNYYDMAEHTAKRINHFLNLPVTLVTDVDSLSNQTKYSWDNIVTIIPDKNNFRDWGMWINKGRYQAYAHSPYDETILLDVDYVVNSNKLLKTFDTYVDFSCHNKTSFLMHPSVPQETLSAYSYETMWATVVTFRKSKRAEQIFQCLEMVQNNYDSHYSNIHSFIGGVYRNDYALTLALKIVNGHYDVPNDYIPWNLVHVGKNTQVYNDTDKDFNTEYTIMFDNWQKGKIRKEYMTIKDMDFHVMSKQMYLDMIPNE